MNHQMNEMNQMNMNPNANMMMMPNNQNQGSMYNQSNNNNMMMMQNNSTDMMMKNSNYVQQQGVYSQPMQQMNVFHPPSHFPKELNYEGIFQDQTACMVKQLVEVVEIVLGFETENKYQAYFNNGMKLQCFEDSNWFNRIFLKNKRPFEMKIYCNKTCVLTFKRPFYWFLSDLKVYDPINNKKLGKIKQKFSLCERIFDIYVDDDVKYQIVCGCCEWFTFHIRTLDGKEVGSIKKQWNGLLKMAVGSDADNFGVMFPKNASSKDKAVLFAATFLIDFLYFERNGNNENRGTFQNL